MNVDVLIIGGGTAGLAAAIETAGGGRSCLLIEREPKLGGTLAVSSGQMSAGGTRIQAQKGITDSPAAHFDDVMRISGGNVDVAIVRRAAELAPSVIDWLMANGFDLDPICPALYHFHEAYTVPRTYWGRERGQSILAVLERLIDPLIASGRIQVWHESAAVGLELTSARDGIAHVDVDRSGDLERVAADHVILAGGGHANSAELLRQLTIDQPVLRGAWQGADGSLLSLCRDAGMDLRGTRIFVPTFGGVEEPYGSGRVDRSRLPQLVPQYRPPWEVYVDAHGRRFVREDSDSVDEREKRLATLDPMYFWIVFDEHIRRTAPPLLEPWHPDEVERALHSRPDFAVADSLAKLAIAIGIDAEPLAETVDAYNRAVVGEQPDAMGRRHLPEPIRKAPFYAMKNYASVVKSFAGLQVTPDLHPVVEGRPLANTSVVGELLGGAATAGDAFVGGMSLTPALAFGRSVGQELGAGAR